MPVSSKELLACHLSKAIETYWKICKMALKNTFDRSIIMQFHVVRNTRMDN